MRQPKKAWLSAKRPFFVQSDLSRYTLHTVKSILFSIQFYNF